MKAKTKTNPKLVELVRSLRKASRENRTPIWLAISNSLSKPRKNMAQINISRIARLTKGGETVAVPGKVLGAGLISHRLTVAALSFSADAAEKIRAVGGRCVTLNELLRENPSGAQVKIMR